MTIVWRFGEILSNGFRSETQTGFDELTPDAGLPFRRERFTDIQDIISGNFILTLNGYLDFLNWYRNTTRQGTLTFTYFDCRVNKDRVARLIGKPSFSSLSNHYSVNITLSLEPVRLSIPFNLSTEGGEDICTQADELITVQVGITV